MYHSDNIINILKEKNISAYKICKETGISESLFSKWKKNPTSDISSNTLVKIASFLNCSIDYLISFNHNDCSYNLTEYNNDIKTKRIIKVFNSLNNEYKNVAINEIITLIKNNINIDFKNLELLITALDDNLKDDILNILIDLSLKFSDEQIKKANENKAYIAALGGGVTEIDEDLANYIIKNAVPNKPKVPDLKNL